MLGEPTQPELSAVSGWAWLVEHETGESAIKLPAEGGSVWVDVVLAADGPVRAFAGRLGADAAKAVSVATADWTVEGNVACSADVSKCEPGGWYDFGIMEWYTVHADGAMALGTDAAELEGATVVAVWTDVLELSALAGPIEVPAGDVATMTGDLAAATDDAAETTDDAAETGDPAMDDTAEATGDSEEAEGSLFVTAGALGGLTPGLTEAGEWVVATLRLDIAPGRGTVRLLLSDAYAVDATGALILLAPGPDLEIVADQE